MTFASYMAKSVIDVIICTVHNKCLHGIMKSDITASYDIFAKFDLTKVAFKEHTLQLQ